VEEILPSEAVGGDEDDITGVRRVGGSEEGRDEEGGEVRTWHIGMV